MYRLYIRILGKVIDSKFDSYFDAKRAAEKLNVSCIIMFKGHEFLNYHKDEGFQEPTGKCIGCAKD